jgi:hypothetical protein
MLTADEIEALLKETRKASDLARRAFGGVPLTPEEFEQRRRNDGGRTVSRKYANRKRHFTADP